MFVEVSTQLPATESEFWEKISTQESLQFIAAPLVTFKPVNHESSHNTWEIGRNYLFKLYFLGCIPLGAHTIHIIKRDDRKNIISSNESGLLVPVWNHKISFKEIQPGLLSYRDEIEFDAKWLTPFVYFFAQIFYRHRQRRWKKLLKK